MTRSRKKNPFTSFTCAISEKWDKRKNNRKLRKKSKDALRKKEDVMPIMKEVSNLWNMAKDGKQYLTKDCIWYKKGMRK